MLYNPKTNVVLHFYTGDDDKGDAIVKRVTLGNVRNDLTPTEISQVALAFKSLISHTLIDVELVRHSFVNYEEVI